MVTGDDKARGASTKSGEASADAASLSAEDRYTGCFGCGPANPIGLKLEFRRDGDEVAATTTLGPAHAGYEEFVHGGIVATMLDEAMGWALIELADTYAVTESLDVRYRRPVSVGRTVTVRAKVLGNEGTKYDVEARILDDRERLLARATSRWTRVRPERARRSQ